MADKNAQTTRNDKNRLSEIFATHERDEAGTRTAPEIPTSVSISPMQLKKFVAYSLIYAYMFCMLLGSSYFSLVGFGFAQQTMCRIGFLLFGGVCLIAPRLIEHAISAGRHRVFDAACAISACLPLVALLLQALGSSPTAVYVCWTLAGFSMAHLYIKLTPWLLEVRRGSAIAFMGLGNLAAAIIFLITVFLIPYASVVFTTALPLTALLLGDSYEMSNIAVGKDKSTENADGENTADDAARRYARQPWDAILYTLVQCSGLGMGLYCLLSADASTELGQILFAAVIALSCVTLIVDWGGKRLIDEVSISRYLYVMIFFPLTAIVFFRSTVALFACGCIVVALMWIAALVGCASEAESARAQNMRSQVALARGWGLSLSGMAIGAAGGFVGLGIFGDTPKVFGMIFACFGLFVLLATTLADRPHAHPAAPRWDDKPQDFNRLRTTETETTDGDTHVAGTADGDGAHSPEADFETLLANRCDVIGDIYGLSSRQREVFFLLVHGRDSKFIQNKLMISKGTADSHIHNIYLKLNVHSRQELLDLFEGRNSQQ